jgi:hypothetical protein
MDKGGNLMRLRSWFDVERILRKKTHSFAELPAEIWTIDCLYDAVEIGLTDEKQQSYAKTVLKEWLEDEFEQTESVIHLDIDEATIPVEFVVDEKISHKKNVFRPYWEQLEYIKTQLENTETRSYRVDDII